MALGADADQNLSIVVRLKDEASRQLATLKDKVTEVQQQMATTAVDASGKFALGLGAVAAGMGAIIGKGVAVAGELEAARQGFVTLLGSAEKADATMERIKLEAARTPFEVKGLTSATQMLAQVTKDGDRSIDVLLNVGKALSAAGKGQAELDRVIVNLQQISNVGKISEMDIRQFGFAGINVLELLADYYGTTKEGASEMVKTSKDAFKDLEGAFAKAGGAGGKFEQAFINQAGTFLQLMSNMVDVTDTFLSDFVKTSGIFDAVKQALAGIIEVLMKNKGEIFAGIQSGMQWFKENGPLVAGIIIGGLTPAILALVASFVSLATALAPFMVLGAGIGLFIQGLRDGDPVMAGIGATITAIVVPAFLMLSGTILSSVVPSIIALGIAFAPFIIGGVLIGGLVAGVLWLIKHWEEVKAKAQEVWGFVAPYLSGTWQGISESAMSIWTSISDFFKAFWEGVKNVFLLAVALIAGAVITYFKSMGVDIVAVWETVKTAASELWKFMGTEFETGMNVLQISWNSGWLDMKNFIGPVWLEIKNYISEGWQWMLNKFNEYKQPITDAWTFLWNALGAVVDVIWANIKSSVLSNLNWIISKIQVVIDAVNKVASTGGEALGFSAPQIPNIPHLANGGIVNRPTLALIGESGPERVTPLNKSNSGNGDVYVTINNPVVKDQRDVDAIRNAVEDVFRTLNVNRKLSMS